GSTTGTIYVPVIGDTVGEPNETFFVDLSAPVNGPLGATTRATVTILNDDTSSQVYSTTADFAAGSLGSGIYGSETDDGEITLAPAVATEFSGSSLPAGWTSSVLAAGGAATVSSGKLTIDGAALVAPSPMVAGQTIEFVATFTG